MQDVEKSLNSGVEMSPYLGSKCGSPAILTGSPSPGNAAALDDDDVISVGCPTPALQSYGSREASPCGCPEESSEDYFKESSEDYFGPLKKLQMADERRISPTVEPEERADGVKSFSIADILSHKPSKPPCSRIVRPWDIEADSHQRLQVNQQLESFHRRLKAHQQQLALLSGRPEFVAGFGVSYASETGSDRSSSVASDCCSPDIAHQPSATATASRKRTQQPGKQPGGTPLDALFQMTSKTFDSSGGEQSADPNLFGTAQIVKKKRKSRAAFTNHQIFELEKRFLYQKYVSPTIRDEIALSLGITTAQVITWFQNRRAKMKRDMEELKKEVESANLTASLLDNIANFNVLKKKSLMNEDILSRLKSVKK